MVLDDEHRLVGHLHLVHVDEHSAVTTESCEGMSVLVEDDRHVVSISSCRDHGAVLPEHLPEFVFGQFVVHAHSVQRDRASSLSWRC